MSFISNISIVLELLLLIVGVLLSVAFFSLFERKLLSYIQYRKGPNKVSIIGFLQPFADASKLLSKSNSNPLNTSKLAYIFSPLVMFILSLLSWLSYPTIGLVSFISTNILLVLLFFGVSVYGLISSGWFSNSKYSTIGCARSIAQSISYEIPLTFSIFSVMIVSGSLCLNEVLEIQEYVPLFMGMPIMGMCCLISFLAETNRTPFDLSESESELVSGYSVEYGGMAYTMIFLGENLTLIFCSSIFTLLFLWVGMYLMAIVTSCMIIVLFVVIRSTLPRVRFDKLMVLCWMITVPLILSWTVISMITLA